MATNVTLNGSTYSIPAEGDSGWSDLSTYFIAIASSVLQKTGGTFTLTAEANFGATYGLKSAYIKSQGTNPASAGVIRLANAETISWRNAANSADLAITVNSSNALQFNGASLVFSGAIVNADIDAAAAIAYSKLNLATSIVNADISASAAIAYSKLNLATSIVNADISGSAAIAYSKLNLGTSIVNADISASAAIALSKLATVTASRALVSDGSGNVSASSATSTELSRLSGILSSAVGISDTQVLTNKDIDGGTASNARRLTLPKDTLTNLTSLTRKQGTLIFDTTSNKPYFDDGSNLRVFGSGSGAGGNLIDDGDAEAGTSNYVEGSYSAATRPSGTFTSSSGAGSFAISTSSSSPLSGNNSFVLTKSSGASRQGRAVERTINLDLENRAKVLEVRIKYIVSSGSFVAGSNSSDSSLIWYIGQYDGSTWTYTGPSSFKMLSTSTSISDVLIGNFQTNYDTTQVKLIAYVAESADSAWEVKCEVAVQPCNYVYGTPITDWVAYTPAGTWSTNTTWTGFWRRVGQDMEVKFQASLSGAPSGNFTANIPAGYTIDTTKLLSTGTQEEIGFGRINDSGSALYHFSLRYNSTVSIIGINLGASGTYVNEPSVVDGTTPITFGASDIVNGYFKVPITGWSSSTQVSDGYDGRQIVFVGKNSASTSIATTGTYVPFTSQKDSTASWSTDTFVCPSAGDYVVSAGLHGSSASNWFYAQVDKNGTLYARILQLESRGDRLASGSVIVYNCAANDTIKLKAFSDTSSQNLNASADLNFITISKLQSPTTISATEVVAARYTTAAGQSIANGATSIIDFETKDYDTHNAVTTGASWKFIAPAPGLYSVKSFIRYANGLSWTAGSYVNAAFYKNGSSFSTADELIQSTITPGQGPSSKFTDSVWLNAGDYIDMRTAHGESSARALVTAGTLVRIAIERIK